MTWATSVPISSHVAQAMPIRGCNLWRNNDGVPIPRDICPHLYGRICAPRVKTAHLCVPNLISVALSVCKILRGPKFSKMGHIVPIRGKFMIHGKQMPTLYLCTKFEKRSFNRLRNIDSVEKFRNLVTSPIYGAICNL